MLDKIKGYIKKFSDTAKQKINSMHTPIKWVIIAYFALVVLLILTYYAAWCYMWYIGKAALKELLEIIREMIGTSMVAFVTFIGGCFVDLNNNGTPDAWEQKEDD